MADNPNTHAQRHRECIEPVEPRLRRDKISPPALCKFNHTVYRTEDNCGIRDYNCSNKQSERFRLRKRCRHAIPLWVFLCPIPKQNGYCWEDDVSRRLNRDTRFLIVNWVPWEWPKCAWMKLYLFLVLPLALHLLHQLLESLAQWHQRTRKWWHRTSV